MQESLAESAAALARTTGGAPDPAGLGLEDRTWGGAEAVMHSGGRGSAGPGAGDAEAAGGAAMGAPIGWTWAGVGALQSWDEEEMALEIDEIKRELMSGQQGGHSGWETAVENSLLSDSDREGGVEVAEVGDRGDRGSRRATAGKLHRRGVSSVRQSASDAGGGLPAPASATGEGVSEAAVLEEKRKQAADVQPEGAPMKRGRKSSARGRKKGAAALATAEPAADAKTSSSGKQEHLKPPPEDAAAPAAAAPARKKRGRPRKTKKPTEPTTALRSRSTSPDVAAANSATDDSAEELSLIHISEPTRPY